MPTFRRKPSLVEANRFLGPHQRPVIPGVCLGDSECRHDYKIVKYSNGCGKVPYTFGMPHVVTKQGVLVPIKANEWILVEPDGSGYYPVDAEIFASMYESWPPPLKVE